VLFCQPNIESREVGGAEGRAAFFHFRVLMWALLLSNLYNYNYSFHAFLFLRGGIDDTTTAKCEAKTGKTGLFIW
jgi:hypothetical protein